MFLRLLAIAIYFVVIGIVGCVPVESELIAATASYMIEVPNIMSS